MEKNAELIDPSNNYRNCRYKVKLWFSCTIFLCAVCSTERLNCLRSREQLALI